MADIYKSEPPPSRDEEKMVKGSRPNAKGKEEESKKEKKDETPREKVYKIIGKTRNSLSAFVARPKSMNFETQFDREEIILLLRQHIITNLPWVLFTIILIFTPLLFSSFTLIEFLPARFQFIFILMWYLFVFSYSLEKFLSWYFNVYIITDERVVDIDFYNLAYKEISDAEIENIEDVTLIMGGAIQTLFNFGRVQIQTAGQVPEIQFEQVPQPAKIVDVLKQLQLEEKQEAIDGRVM
jgi:membrane protein YdbS with pleckstrin-like domain